MAQQNSRNIAGTKIGRQTGRRRDLPRRVLLPRQHSLCRRRRPVLAREADSHAVAVGLVLAVAVGRRHRAGRRLLGPERLAFKWRRRVAISGGGGVDVGGRLPRGGLVAALAGEGGGLERGGGGHELRVRLGELGLAAQGKHIRH
jgi:hypothetical protein